MFDLPSYIFSHETLSMRTSNVARTCFRDNCASPLHACFFKKLEMSIRIKNQPEIIWTRHQVCTNMVSVALCQSIHFSMSDCSTGVQKGGSGQLSYVFL